MPVYHYRAINSQGKTKGGVVDAESPREAREQLRRAGLHVTEVKPGRGDDLAAPSGRVQINLPNPFKGKHLSELSLVTRQLATLLGAGIPVSDALNALVEQISGTQFEPIFRGVREKITQGASLGGAMASYSDVFGDLYVNMVRAGEAAGNLDEILVRLAEYLRDQYRVRAKITAALTYPAVMAFVGFGVVTFLMAFVVPQIAGLLLKQGAEQLPVPTRILMVAAEVFTGEAFGFEDQTALFYLIVFPLVVALYFVFRSLRQTEKGSRIWDQLLFRLPILGDLFKKQAISRFATTLATLLKSGIPAAESLKIVKRVAGNRVLEDTLAEVHDRIMEGADISAPLKKSTVFPPVVGYMIAVGEQAGQLDDILEKLSHSYDEEIEITTEKVVSLIEPVMICGMALVVGFIVLSIVLPLLEATKMAGGG